MFVINRIIRFEIVIILILGIVCLNCSDNNEITKYYHKDISDTLIFDLNYQITNLSVHLKADAKDSFNINQFELPPGKYDTFLIKKGDWYVNGYLLNIKTTDTLQITVRLF